MAELISFKAIFPKLKSRKTAHRSAGKTLYLYSVNYTAGDGRVKRADMLVCLAPVPEKSDILPGRLYFVYEEHLLEEGVFEAASSRKPLFSKKDGEVLHRIWAATPEEEKTLRSEFSRATFAHEVLAGPVEGGEEPVLVGNAARPGWAFITEVCTPGYDLSDETMNSIRRAFEVREYPFPGPADRDSALLDFVEDLRFENVAVPVIGLVPGGGNRFILLMGEPEQDMVEKFEGLVGKASFRWERRLADEAVREALKNRESLLVKPAPLRRDVVIAAQKGRTKIREIPLCFEPVRGIGVGK